MTMGSRLRNSAQGQGVGQEGDCPHLRCLAELSVIGEMLHVRAFQYGTREAHVVAEPFKYGRCDQRTEV